MLQTFSKTGGDYHDKSGTRDKSEKERTHKKKKNTKSKKSDKSEKDETCRKKKALKTKKPSQTSKDHGQ